MKFLFVAAIIYCAIILAESSNDKASYVPQTKLCVAVKNGPNRCVSGVLFWKKANVYSCDQSGNLNTASCVNDCSNKDIPKCSDIQCIAKNSSGNKDAYVPQHKSCLTTEDHTNDSGKCVSSAFVRVTVCQYSCALSGTLQTKTCENFFTNVLVPMCDDLMFIPKDKENNNNNGEVNSFELPKPEPTLEQVTADSISDFTTESTSESLTGS